MIEQARFFAFPWLVLCLLLLVTAGCQQRTAGRLHGRWIGKPDSVAAKAAREAEKYGDSPEQTSDDPNAERAQRKPATDWEGFDVQVELNFLNGSALELALGGADSKVAGRWSIIETSPTGCTIEVTTEEPAQEGERVVSERRRFELLFDERDGELVGFELSEVGADRQVGALYFQRAK